MSTFLLAEICQQLYGRGSTDDKGPVIAWLNAIEGLLYYIQFHILDTEFRNWDIGLMIARKASNMPLAPLRHKSNKSLRL